MITSPISWKEFTKVVREDNLTIIPDSQLNQFLQDSLTKGHTEEEILTSLNETLHYLDVYESDPTKSKRVYLLKAKDEEEDEETEEDDEEGDEMGGEEDEASDDQEDDDSEEGEEDEGEDGDLDDDGDGEVSDEDKQQVLAALTSLMADDDDGSVSVEDLTEEENWSDDHTTKVLLALEADGKVKLNKSDKGIEVVEVLDSGSDEGDDSEDMEDDSSDDEDMGDDEGGIMGDGDMSSDDEEGDDQGIMGDGGDADGDEGDDMDAESGDGEIDPEDSQQEGQDPSQQDEQINLTDEDLNGHAKNTSDEDLQKFINNPASDPKLVQIAKNELTSRQQGQGGVQDGQQPQTPDMGGGLDQAGTQDPNDFNTWLDGHFDEYDIEDLQKLTKDIALSIPSERKTLKNHYRQDYQKTNGGNTLAKVDDKEFENWVLTYLEHKPFDHLKKYTVELANKAPNKIKDIKAQYDQQNQTQPKPNM